jgi:hypothetical protein
MMKNRTIAVAGLLAISLAVAPITPAFAWGRHGGGHYGGGPILGLIGAVVATTAYLITAPFAIVAAAAQAPLYYQQGPMYGGSPPVYYNTPPVGPGYYGNAAAPTYSYSTPQPAPYYAPAPTQSQGEWYYCADSKSYYPYVRECPAGWQRVPAQPPGADYYPR